MKRWTVVLSLALALVGCQGPGPLPDGQWFLQHREGEAPHVWLGRSLANIGLFAWYLTAGAAYLMAPRTELSAPPDHP